MGMRITTRKKAKNTKDPSIELDIKFHLRRHIELLHFSFKYVYRKASAFFLWH